MTVTTGPITVVGPTTPLSDEEIQELRLEEPDDAESWFCVRTAPFPCPAPGCEFVAGYLTCAHLIVVWPSRDDPWLLANAADARRLGREPQVLQYRRAFGPCLAFDLWVALGRPIHGSAEATRPEGAPRPSRRL